MTYTRHLKALCLLLSGMMFLAGLGPVTTIGTASAAPPNGSWQKSCKNPNINTAGKTINADCRNGGFFGSNFVHAAIIRYDLCVGDISNDHGKLRCSRGAANATIPASANKTCQDGFVSDGNLLSALCRRKNGNWKWSTVTRGPSCEAMDNSDGTLVCAGKAQGGATGGGPGTLPNKPWPLCISKNGFKTDDTVVAQTPELAILKKQKELPDGGLGFFITSGVCQRP